MLSHLNNLTNSKKMLKVCCEVYISAPNQVRKVQFSSNVHATSMYIYKQNVSDLSRLSNSAQCRRSLYFQAQALFLA